MSLTEFIGLVVGVAGFGVTIQQIRLAKTAAEAARDAAATAVSSVRRLEAATKMQDIGQRSRELLRLLRGKGNLQGAAQAAFELRDAMAKYRHDTESQLVVHRETWERAVSDARRIHQRLESSSLVNRITTEERENLLHEVATLHTQFTSFATVAIVSESINANPG